MNIGPAASTSPQPFGWSCPVVIADDRDEVVLLSTTNRPPPRSVTKVYRLVDRSTSRSGVIRP
jgi:hypothetical protein